MEGMTYDGASVTVAPGSRLYVFSDGVYEVQLPEGREMSLEDFIPLVAAPPSREAGLEAIRTTVGDMQGRMRFDDDFSLVEVLFH
jgi:sigma-B regulation protein RsbU (phosphoserine phosphatase)